MGDCCAERGSGSLTSPFLSSHPSYGRERETGLEPRDIQLGRNVLKLVFDISPELTLEHITSARNHSAKLDDVRAPLSWRARVCSG